MDVAGIAWDYEQTWLETPFGNWLPDFRLRDGRWVEVKGMLTGREHERLLLMAEAVGEHDGSDVVVLGHLPEGEYHWPVQLHMHYGVLWAVPWALTSVCPDGLAPAVPAERITADILLSGLPTGQPRWAEAPLHAARQARFS